MCHLHSRLVVRVAPVALPEAFTSGWALTNLEAFPKTSLTLWQPQATQRTMLTFSAAPQWPLLTQAAVRALLVAAIWRT